ncbi:MAG: universal stress protein [Ectothiorhodospiraceae bacterium]|nr:universal stress protein [Ectothiorhodospiraceae bacterium]
MQQILVSTDGSGYSLMGLRVGSALAGQLGMPVKLISIVPDTQALDDRRHAIERALEETKVDPRPALEVVPDTSPAKHLCDVLAEHPDALLCMTTHGRRPVTEALMGSVASQVVRDSGRLVFLAGPRLSAHWQGPVNRLIVCVDGSPLSEDALPLAVELGQMLKAQVQLVHVIEPDAMPGGSGRHSISGDFSSSVSHSPASDVSESAYVQNIARRLKQQHGVSVDWDVLHGSDPAEALASYAGSLPGAMLVMTTHGRSGLGQNVKGSVTSGVLHAAQCPVAVYRPSDTM